MHKVMEDPLYHTAGALTILEILPEAGLHLTFCLLQALGSPIPDLIELLTESSIF